MLALITPGMIHQTQNTNHSQILTWTEKHHPPFQLALHGAALMGPTAGLGSEATFSFPPPGGGRAVRNGRADICVPRQPDTDRT